MSSRVVSLPVILRRLIPSVFLREEVPKNLRIMLFTTEGFFAALRMTEECQ
jgi:hypothetical protein